MPEVNFEVRKGLTVPRGTAAAPSIVFDPADLNTGLYSPGADQLALATNGTGRLFVDASGNVGVGSAPSSTAARAVDINGGSLQPVLLLRASSATSATTTYTLDPPNSIVEFISSDWPVRYYINGSERMRITSAGLVGIGTSSPDASLDVVGASSSNLFRIGNSSGGTDFRISVTENTGTVINSAEGATGRSIQFQSGGANTVTLSSTGAVGIGTTSPTADLSIGDTSTTASRQIRLHGPTSGTAGGASVNIVNGTDTVFAAGNASNVIGGSYSSDAMLFWGNSALRFYGNSSERARIDSSGRLLVGTSSASGSSLLQVNGDTIRIATAKTPASATATGTAGEVCWDTSYIYVCTATNTWKRAALSTW